MLFGHTKKLLLLTDRIGFTVISGLSILRMAMRVLGLAFISLILSACSEEPRDEQSSPGVDWRDPVRVASGAGHKGPWRMNESDFRYVDDPTVAFFSDGDIGVAWVDQARQNLYFQRFRDGRPQFETPVNVSRSSETFSWLPRMRITDDNHVLILWQEIVFSGGSHGGEAFFARSVDGGRSFEAPQNLSSTTHGVGKGRLTRRLWHNGSLALAVAPGGRVYVAWTEYEGPLRLIRSSNGGRDFSDPQLIAGGGNALPTRGPSLAVGPEGRLHLAWAVGEDPEADIRYTAFRPGEGASVEPRRIAAGPDHADAPKLAVAADGTVHLSWMASDDSSATYDIRYSRKAAGVDTFAAPATISRPLPNGFTQARFPYLELDQNGHPHLLFELFRNGAHSSEGLARVRSTDHGASFGPPRRVPRGGDTGAGINGSLQGQLMDKLALSGEGRIAVVNSTFVRGERSDVWLMRGRLR